jgi:hypothetical protein
MPVPKSADLVILSDDLPDDGGANLCRVRPDGSEVWRATPPDGPNDLWTEAEVDGDVVSAFSWSCYRVRLDLSTGCELERVFTK